MLDLQVAKLDGALAEVALTVERLVERDDNIVRTVLPTCRQRLRGRATVDVNHPNPRLAM